MYVRVLMNVCARVRALVRVDSFIPIFFYFRDYYPPTRYLHLRVFFFYPFLEIPTWQHGIDSMLLLNTRKVPQSTRAHIITHALVSPLAMHQSICTRCAQT